jgi:hypothetical protein
MRPRYSGHASQITNSMSTGPPTLFTARQRGPRSICSQPGAASSCTKKCPTRSVITERDYAAAALRGQHMQLGFLQHSLMISRMHFCIEMACRQSPAVELVAWRQGGPVACKLLAGTMPIDSWCYCGADSMWSAANNNFDCCRKAGQGHFEPTRLGPPSRGHPRGCTCSMG